MRPGIKFSLISLLFLSICFINLTIVPVQSARRDTVKAPQQNSNLQLSTPVQTTEGPVQGEIISDKVVAFRGIPYAMPPVGNLRWREPQPPQVHQDIFMAINFGSICAQPVRQASTTTDVSGSEDCLFLNIWAPKDKVNQPLPVMFFIHGGGNINGSSSSTRRGNLEFDGQPFVEKASVILVTINYRLGPFGFLAHPALSKEDTAHQSSGNYAILDQLAALKWVQKNIANFGGDPKNVTIFGQSAGGSDVMGLVVSPLSAGLFHKAISESGLPILINRRISDSANSPNGVSAFDQGQRLATALGCENSADIADCLRKQSPEQLLRAVPADQTGDLLKTKNNNYNPIVDGYVIPAPSAEILSQGKQNLVPIMIGSTRDEILGFIRNLGFDVQTESQIGLVVTIVLGPDAVKPISARYPVTDYGSPLLTLNAIGTDFVFYCPIREAYRSLARNNPAVYVYLFAHAPDGDKSIGVLHSAELGYVFNNIDRTSNVPVSPAEVDLANKVFSYWTNFARTGNPNGSGLPDWPLYKRNGDKMLMLETEIETIKGYRKGFCRFLDKLSSKNSFQACSCDGD